MDHLRPSHQLTECGHVYVNPEDSSLFVINCLFCNKEYCEWSIFINHLQGHLETKQEYDDIDEKLEIRSEYTEENEFEYLEKFVDIQIQYAIEDQQQKSLSDVEDCTIKTEFFNREDLLAIELLDNDIQDVAKEDLQCKHLEDYDNDELIEEYLLDSMEANNVDLGADFVCKKDKLIETQNTANSSKPISTSFFRLNTTDTNVMLKFIQLLRKHPIQWDQIHPDIANKDKRIASSLELTIELNTHFNLNITPQGTRSSVLCLVRWFEQEYIRLMRCEEKDLQFVSLRKEYFEKLLEFLPYKHLKPMTCDECLKHFKSEHLLMAHKHKYHNGEVPFQCRFCGRGFIHHSSHKLHENRHIKIQLWPCKKCLYQAATKADYIKHLATHSSKQPYKCDICGLCYKTSSNLNVHKKCHGSPQYECEICKKKFYEKYRFKRHIWLHDKDDQTCQSIDNFICHICGRRFASNTTLMKHKLVHIQENYGLDNMTDSQQKQNKDMIVVYYCDYCSLEFINKEAFQTHMNLKHNNE